MKNELVSTLAEAISKISSLDINTVKASLERPRNPAHGDLAFPCFHLTKLWKTPPNICAERLKNELSLPEVFSSAETAGPFLNFRFNRQVFAARANQFIATRLVRKASRPEKIILEYSSPNIAKPFHIGHLRATLIGNSLNRIYLYLGYPVVSINHLGDWGTQFGFVWAGCELWGKPADTSVQALVELYRRATALKEKQEKKEAVDGGPYPDVNEMARGFFLDLESGKEYATKFWKWCVDISLQYLKHTYARLDVRFDHYTGESFYSTMLPAVKADLEQASLLKFSQGAYGVDLGEELGFARILTPDGRSLYLTRDLATAKYRAETFQFDRAIYVVGAPQTLHFRQIIAILKALGRPYAEKIMHVPFGQVLGMKTRGDGEFVELNDFLDEAEQRALEAYHKQVTKRPEGLDQNKIAAAVARAAIVFSSLSTGNNKDVHFSWDHALEFHGDSGPYLLYALARINGINDKAKEAGLVPENNPSAEHLVDDHSFALLSLLVDFETTLERTIGVNDPSILAAYALELARTFSKAYNELKVLGEEKALAQARLSLFEQTKNTLTPALELLGIPPLERM